MSRRRVLTVEDDAAIRRGIVDALQFSGYEVLQAATFAEGLASARNMTYDLLLLDVILPDGTGLDILSEIRESRPHKPVIMLTARGDESDRVRGLRLGADDYVVKPFSVKELLARVEAVLRRTPVSEPAAPPVDLPGYGRPDLARSEFLNRHGNRLDLSPRECDLIAYLMRHQDRPVSREELLEKVWGIDSRGVTTRTIDMHTARLREKLGDRAEDPQLIATIRSRGYLWRAESSLAREPATPGTKPPQ